MRINKTREATDEEYAEMVYWATRKAAEARAAEAQLAEIGALASDTSLSDAEFREKVSGRSAGQPGRTNVVNLPLLGSRPDVTIIELQAKLLERLEEIEQLRDVTRELSDLDGDLEHCVFDRTVSDARFREAFGIRMVNGDPLEACLRLAGWVNVRSDGGALLEEYVSASLTAYRAECETAS